MTSVPEHIYELILQDLSSGLSSEELSELQQWIEESTQNKDAWKELCSMWHSGKSIGYDELLDKGKIWETISKRVRVAKQRRLYIQLASAAASVLIVFSLYVTYKQTILSSDQLQAINIQPATGEVKLILESGQEIELNDSVETEMNVEGEILNKTIGEISYCATQAHVAKPKKVYHQLIVPKGEQYKLTLADGTQVSLNSESNIKFPTQFNDSLREVWISGEAYFEVAHDKKHPFIVHSSDLSTKVLGTEFNVRAYEDDDQIEVTLVNGSVEVSLLSNKIMIKPGYQLLAHRGEQMDQALLNKVDTYLYTGWTKGILYFDDIRLEDLMKNISHWYDITFEFKSEMLKNGLYTGGVRKSEPIAKFFSLVEQVNDIQFTVVDNHIIIDDK